MNQIFNYNGNKITFQLGNGDVMISPYSVSKNGDVYRNGKKLKPLKHSQGYLFVNLSINGVRYPMLIHRIVASAFIENPKNKKTVNHKNGDKTDNRVTNLEWATQSENNKHAYAFLGKKASPIGLKQANIARKKKINTVRKKISEANRLENNGMSILSVDEVLEIRKKAKNKYYGYVKDLISEYKVSKSCIQNIISNRSWNL